VVDLRMPGGSGLDVVRALRALPKAPQVVVLTGYGTIGTAVEAIRLGALNYLTKPADADEIEAALQGKRPPPMDDVPSLDRQEWEYLNRILADCSGKHLRGGTAVEDAPAHAAAEAPESTPEDLTSRRSTSGPAVLSPAPS